MSVPPVVTCRHGAPCCSKCYARKGRFSFRHNKELLRRNLDIWRTDPEGFERDLVCAAYTSRFFRFHSAGDIPDAAYLEMMVRVAEACKYTSFLCFTKKYELVNAYLREHRLPPNLKIVFSAWKDFQPENPFDLPVAYIKFKHEETSIPDDAMHCSGYCGACVQTGRSCWDLQPGQSVYFDEH